MSEQLYRIHGKSEVTGNEWSGTGAFPRDEAQRYADELSKRDKDFRLRYWIEPVLPGWTPPHIIAKEIPETSAGSPGCADGEYLLGVKPPGC